MRRFRSWLFGFGRIRLGICHLRAHCRTRLHLVLTGGDHLVSRRKTAIDYRPSVDRLADLDLAQLSLVLLIDDVSIQPVRAVLYSIIWNDRGILKRLHEQARGDRLARP